MSFKLDTSGWVSDHNADREAVWSDLSSFEQGYVREMLTYAICEMEDTPLVKDGLGWKYPGFSDLAPETLARIREDCAAYRQRLLPSDLNHARYGEGFWIDRQRAGSHFPPLTLYLGDDGKVRFR